MLLKLKWWIIFKLLDLDGTMSFWFGKPERRNFQTGARLYAAPDMMPVSALPNFAMRNFNAEGMVLTEIEEW